MRLPNFKEHQFCVVMSNDETGIILNNDLDIYRKDEEKDVYTTFESIQEARNFTTKISMINNKIEFTIYNYKQEVIEFVKAKYL